MIEIKYRPYVLHFALRCDPQLTYCIMVGSRLSKQDEMMAHYKIYETVQQKYHTKFEI